MKKRILSAIIATAMIFTLAITASAVTVTQQTTRDGSKIFLPNAMFTNNSYTVNLESGENGFGYEVDGWIYFGIIFAEGIGAAGNAIGKVQLDGSGFEIIWEGILHLSHNECVGFAISDGWIYFGDEVEMFEKITRFSRVSLDGQTVENDVQMPTGGSGAPVVTTAPPAASETPKPVNIKTGKDLELPKINMPLEDLTAVMWGDKALARDVDYTAREGSTIITLKQSFLDSLPSGTHTIIISFGDTVVEQQVVKASGAGSATDDEDDKQNVDSGVVGAAVFFGLALTATGVAVISRRKRNK